MWTDQIKVNRQPISQFHIAGNSWESGIHIGSKHGDSWAPCTLQFRSSIKNLIPDMNHSIELYCRLYQVTEFWSVTSLSTWLHPCTLHPHTLHMPQKSGWLLILVALLSYDSTHLCVSLCVSNSFSPVSLWLYILYLLLYLFHYCSLLPDITLFERKLIRSCNMVCSYWELPWGHLKGHWVCTSLADRYYFWLWHWSFLRQGSMAESQNEKLARKNLFQLWAGPTLRISQTFL